MNYLSSYFAGQKEVSVVADARLRAVRTLFGVDQ